LPEFFNKETGRWGKGPIVQKAVRTKGVLSKKKGGKVRDLITLGRPLLDEKISLVEKKSWCQLEYSQKKKKARQRQRQLGGVWVLEVK